MDDQCVKAAEGQFEEVLAFLTEQWQTVLELDEPPAPSDDFFELGGNSYKAFFLIGNLGEGYDGKLDLNDFYELETLEAMARELAERISGE